MLRRIKRLSRLVPIPSAIKALRGDEELGAGPPRYWFRRKEPRTKRICYRVKSDALRVFLNENWPVVEEYGGESYPAGCSEFDPVNHKYQIPKTRCAKSIADAVWYALPGAGPGGGSPYCLDQIDLEALNDTAAGRIGEGFRLPDHVLEALAEREQEREWDRQAVEEGMSDCFSSFRRRGRFVKASPDATKGREHRCVCRDPRGRFERCGASDEIPF